MAAKGWKQLHRDVAHCRGPGRFPIPAYSEFMPSPRLGCKPYGWVDPSLFDAADPWGWHVNEYQEAFELRPGLAHLAQQILHALVRLGMGDPAHGIAKHKLTDNPYWPRELSAQAGRLRHERYVALMPLALSRTQDDKGRVRWTLFGGSEQGPARAFWKSFFTAPGQELPAQTALGFLRQLLSTVYREPAAKVVDLRDAGFRILPDEDDELPSWVAAYRLRRGEPLGGVRYLLTFRPFADLPPSVRKAYLDGQLHLLPFPGSLLFWGIPTYGELRADYRFAMQIPLLHVVARHEDPHGIRVPQSGWLHEPRAGGPGVPAHLGPFRNTYVRTHRWQRIHREQDELKILPQEDKLAHVLFSTQPEDVGLYGKPMARNAQIWTEDFRWLLDGPHARPTALRKAGKALAKGGNFGYRFIFPAMQVLRHKVFWHRPLAAYWSPKSKQAVMLADAPLGYLTAYPADRTDLARSVELWPRLLERPEHVAAIKLFASGADHLVNTRNIRTLLETSELLSGRASGCEPLEPSFARQLITLQKHETLDTWLESLPRESRDAAKAKTLVTEVRKTIRPQPTPLPKRRAAATPDSLTFHRTARRSFEVAYWKMITALAEGRYVNKDNADCVRDPPTQAALAHRHSERDLEALGDYILEYYRRVVAKAGMERKALVGDLPFSWQTDFQFTWSGGWLKNRDGEHHERNLLVVIPGRDRSRAVIMADHYDTAYMEDIYETGRGGSGARLSAVGADDNHSATAALMLGAPIFLELSKAGKLDCDVWLVHLTGEEFPSDCLGARHLSQALVEGTLKIRLAGGRERDLSKTRVQGVYVSDMIAHNNERKPDTFQMAPGTSRDSMWLAWQAHQANEIWNASTPVWNARPDRAGRGRGQRSADGSHIPALALHPQLSGEVRVVYNPRSTLYNTDGQIFSDAGIPVVLFMENYDINRTGYHDTHDTMENIDLDYGSALAAIVIESVARAASEKPLGP